MTHKSQDAPSGRRGGAAINAAISFLALSSQQTSAFVITLLAAGVLTATEYGVYTLAVVFVEFVIMLTYTGYFHFVVNSEEDEETVLSTMFWVMVGIGTLGGALMILCAEPLSRLFDAPALAPVLRAFGLLQPFGSAIGWATAALTRAGLMRRYFLMLGTSNFGAMIGGAVALLLWHSVFALVIFRCIRIGLGVVLFGAAVPIRPRLLFDPALAWRATRYASGLYGARLLTFFSNFGTDLILAGLFSTAEAGLYRFANRLALATLDLVAQPLRSFSLKSFGEAARTRAPLETPFALYFGVSVLLMGVFAVTLLLLGPAAVELFFRPDYAAAILAMQAMSVRAFARVGQSMIEPVFAAHKTTRMAMWFNLALAAATLGSILIFAQAGFTVLSMAQAGVQILSVPLALWAIAAGAGIDIRPGLQRGVQALGLVVVYAIGLAVFDAGAGMLGLSSQWSFAAVLGFATIWACAVAALALKLKVLSLSIFAG